MTADDLLKKCLESGLFGGKLPKTWVAVEEVPAEKLLRYRVTAFHALRPEDVELRLLGCYQRFPGHFVGVLVDPRINKVIKGRLYQDTKNGAIFIVVTYRRLGFLPKQIRLLKAKGKK